MRKTSVILALGIFLVGLVGPAAFGQSAQDILDKMLEAQGGRKILSETRDTTYSGTMEMPSMGMSGAFTSYQKEPNMMRLDIELMGMMITQAFDGETAWQIDPMTGSAAVMPDNMAAYTARQSLGNDAFLDPGKYGLSFTLKGKETEDGKEYLVLEQAWQDGFTASLYIDPETYLTYKVKALTMDQMGTEVDGETILSDYENIEGRMVPKSIVLMQAGTEFVSISVTEYKFNSGLEDSLFKMQ